MSATAPFWGYGAAAEGSNLPGMTFKEGQQVRVKNQPLTGRVAKKLTSLDDVYVILLDPAPAPEEKLVRGADLELIASEDQGAA